MANISCQVGISLTLPLPLLPVLLSLDLSEGHPSLPSHNPRVLLTPPLTPLCQSPQDSQNSAPNTSHPCLFSGPLCSIISSRPHPAWPPWSYFSLICSQLRCHLNINLILFLSCLKLFKSFIQLSDASLRDATLT